MAKYKSDDAEPINYHAELKRLLGEKFIGCTVRSDVGLVEVRTTEDLTIDKEKIINDLAKKKMSKT